MYTFLDGFRLSKQHENQLYLFLQFPDIFIPFLLVPSALKEYDFFPLPFYYFCAGGNVCVEYETLTFPGSFGDFDTIEEGGKCSGESTISWVNAEYTEQQRTHKISR